MSELKKRGNLVAIAAVAMLTATACGGSGGDAAGGGAPGVSDDRILVGAYLGVSGPIALTAEFMERGWRVAFDEINAAGGVNGRNIELVVRDDNYDPAQSVAAVRDLIQNEQVFVVTGLGSPTTQAVDGFVNTAEVPNLFPLAGSSVLYEAPAEYTLLGQPTYESQGYLSVKYGIEEEGVTALGIMQVNNESGADVAAGCKRAAEELNVPVVGEQLFDGTATEFTGQLTVLRSAGADGICQAATLDPSGLQIRQAAQLGYAPQWLGFSTQANDKLIELAGQEAAQGTIAVSTFLPTASTEDAAVRFQEAYLAEFPDDELTYFSQYGYWAAHLMADAFEEAGDDLTRENVRDVILGWEDHPDSTGLSGPLTFGPDKPNGLDSLFIVQVVNQNFEAVSEAIEVAPR